MQPIPPPPTTTAAPKALPPRQAEASDARLGIREHEEQPKRKKDQETKLDLTLPADVFDQAVLPVQGVIDFLHQFLRTQETPSRLPEDIQISTDQHPQNPPQGAPATPQALAAARAYGHAAETKWEQKPTSALPAATTLLGGAEIRQIHRVLKGLETILARGVMTITLGRAATFLDSLEDAVDKALQGSGP
jgi:hypothetical protein